MKGQSRSQRPRSFWSATGIGTSGIIRFPTTGFLLSSRLRRPKPVWKMASNSEDSFHEAIKFSLEKLGKPDLELKREQFEAIRAVCVERKDVLAVLPTGFGKSLIYQILPAIFDFFRSRGDKQEENSVVIVVSPLNALMKDQLKKLEGFLNVCVVQSVEDEEGENKVNLPQDVRKCSLLFGHPEVFVDHKNTAKMLKEKHFQESVQAIVIDEAHLVQQWLVYFSLITHLSLYMNVINK